MDTRHRPRLLVLTSTYPRDESDTNPGFVKHLSERLCDRFEIYVLAPHFSGVARIENVNETKVFRYRYASQKWETLAYDGCMLNRLADQPWRYLLVPTFMAS